MSGKELQYLLNIAKGFVKQGELFKADAEKGEKTEADKIEFKALGRGYVECGEELERMLGVMNS
jgi:hypothetical protein